MALTGTWLETGRAGASLEPGFVDMLNGIIYKNQASSPVAHHLACHVL